MYFVKLILLLVLSLFTLHADAAEMKIAIRADFPGGNVLVVKNEGPMVELAPDLRGGKPWFYWHFEATASAPGAATFAFAGSPMFTVQGPAYSVDEGKTWQWLGADHCEFTAATTPAKERRETFSYDFTAKQLKVRFAVAIPYLPDNLSAFIAANKANAHFKASYLTKTRTGTPVEQLQIGEPGAGRNAMFVSARHHACESLASYVLEGFLAEAMSDSPAGKAFRERYYLFAVPMVDRDGVAHGDQGKNRDPHDHNRDYGPMPIFPEVAAIQELGEAHDIKYALDFHCPYLRGDIHEAFHFLGLGTPRVKENLDEFIAWIREERPQILMGPLNYLADPNKPGAVNPKISSHHFALRKDAVFAATLEVPYTQAKPALTPDLARAYGAGMLRAWVRTKFATTDAEQSRGTAGSAEFVAFRTNFLKLYRSKPDEAEAAAKAFLADDAAPTYRTEANNLLALLRLSQRKLADARTYCDAAATIPNRTVAQRIATTTELLQIAAEDPQANPKEVEELIQTVDVAPELFGDQAAKPYEAGVKFYETRKQYPRAIELARKQQPVAALHETGKVLNHIAALYDLAGEPKQAIAAREECVKMLRERLGPTPKRNIFAAMMTLDLFDAVCGIPSSTLADKQAAAKLVLDHEIVAEQYKSRVRKQLAQLEAKP